MDIIQIRNTQEEIVKAIFAFHEHRWDILVYNVEIEQDGPGYHTSKTSLSFTKEGNTWNSESLKYSPRGLFQLYGVLWNCFDEKDRWSSFTLEIWKSGKYNFEFHYGPPPRITSDTLDVPFEYTPRDEEE